VERNAERFGEGTPIPFGESLEKVRLVWLEPDGHDHSGSPSLVHLNVVLAHSSFLVGFTVPTRCPKSSAIAIEESALDVIRRKGGDRAPRKWFPTAGRYTFNATVDGEPMRSVSFEVLAQTPAAPPAGNE
jgi:hypothetical protein